MSQFYASISGSAKTPATRRGHASTGIQGHVRGWHGGVRIDGAAGSDNREYFYVYATNGSKGGASDVLLGYVDESGQWHPAHD